MDKSKKAQAKAAAGNNVVLLDQANLIVLAATNPEAQGTDWYPILPEAVPQELRNPEVMGELVKGGICQVPGSDSWFRVEKVPQV